ncbi:hypothetical protein B0H14DRAFT_1008702 [Mycena olivaceomarginata]|nr:hypothetical protein B0H14DRAFT_1008702 [Mycena olivaceomarginata]
MPAGRSSIRRGPCARVQPARARRTSTTQRARATRPRRRPSSATPIATRARRSSLTRRRASRRTAAGPRVRSPTSWGARAACRSRTRSPCSRTPSRSPSWACSRPTASLRPRWTVRADVCAPRQLYRVPPPQPARAVHGPHVPVDAVVAYGRPADAARGDDAARRPDVAATHTRRDVQRVPHHTRQAGRRLGYDRRRRRQRAARARAASRTPPLKMVMRVLRKESLNISVNSHQCCDQSCPVGLPGRP